MPRLSELGCPRAPIASERAAAVARVADERVGVPSHVELQRRLRVIGVEAVQGLDEMGLADVPVGSPAVAMR